MIPAGFRFQDPLWLLGLVPLVVVFAVLHVRRNRRAPALVYSSKLLFDGAPRSFLQRVKDTLPYLRLLGLVLIVVALARPQQGRAETRVRQDAIAIQMVADRSGSMDALDFTIDGKQANRLAVVKNVFRDFVLGDGDHLAGRKDDLIGLIVFGGYPETRCPLTFDHEALAQILDKVEIGSPDTADEAVQLDRAFFKEERATAIGDALGVAVDRLSAVDAKTRIAILLSDGEQTAGVLSPEEGAELAKKAGIKVYTIGIGSTGLVPFPVYDTFGRRHVTMEAMTLDEETLQKVAETTGGAYFNAKDTKALVDVYAKIDKLERTTIERSVFTAYDERAWFVLVPGVVLLVLHFLLAATRFVTTP